MQSFTQSDMRVIHIEWGQMEVVGVMRIAEGHDGDGIWPPEFSGHG